MGVAYSSVQNTVRNELSSSISQTMEQEVNSNLSVTCKNSMEIVGAKGCNVKFGPQVCKASGIADVTTNANFTAKATHDMFNTLEQKAKNSISGITVGASISKTSNFARTIMDVSTKTVQSFVTDCSKNASGLNEKILKDCTDSNIEYAEQNSDVSVMGNCAASATASTDAFSKLTNVVGQTAEAEIKGIDIMGFMLLLLLPLLFLLVGPSLISSITSSWRRNDDSEESKSRAASGKLLGYLTVFLVAYMSLAWPGLGAGLAHVYPWPPGIVNYKEDFCSDGKAGVAQGEKYNIDPRVFINDFYFYDKDCVLQPPGEPCEKGRHYKSCGIFSGVCDDPDAKADVEAYKAALQACEGLSGMYESFVTKAT